METKFVNNFILKQRQERLLYELQRKRGRAVDRFSHSIEEMLNSNKIVLIGESLQLDDVMKVLRGYNISLEDLVCIISGNETLDTKRLSLKEAIKFFFDEYLQMVITDGERFAIIKEEFSGKAKKCILINCK